MIDPQHTKNKNIKAYIMTNYLKPYLSQFRSSTFNMNVINDDTQPLIEFKKGDDVYNMYCEDIYLTTKEKKGKVIEEYINYNPTKYLGKNLTHVVFTNVTAGKVIVMKHNSEKIAKVITKYKPKINEGEATSFITPLKQFMSLCAIWDVKSQKYFKEDGTEFPKFNPFKV
jgi:hypothetical protein